MMTKIYLSFFAGVFLFSFGAQATMTPSKRLLKMYNKYKPCTDSVKTCFESCVQISDDKADLAKVDAACLACAKAAVQCLHNHAKTNKVNLSKRRDRAKFVVCFKVAFVIVKEAMRYYRRINKDKWSRTFLNRIRTVYIDIARKTKLVSGLLRSPKKTCLDRTDCSCTLTEWHRKMMKKTSRSLVCQ